MRTLRVLMAFIFISVSLDISAYGFQGDWLVGFRIDVVGVSRVRDKEEEKLAGFLSRMFGKKNEAAEVVAKEIAETALFCGKAFVDNMTKDNDDNITPSDSRAFATNEYLYFFLHYVNRIAFVVGEVAVQQKVCDDISHYARARLAATLDEKFRTECMSMLIDGLNEAEREYSKCKRLSPEGDESLKGTLFWEASKRISASAGGGMGGCPGFCVNGVSLLLRHPVFELDSKPV